MFPFLTLVRHLRYVSDVRTPNHADNLGIAVQDKSGTGRGTDVHT